MAWLIVETSRMGDRCTSYKSSARYSPFASKKTKEHKQLPPDRRPSTACGEQKEKSCFASHPFAQHCRNIDCCTPGFYECGDQGRPCALCWKEGSISRGKKNEIA